MVCPDHASFFQNACKRQLILSDSYSDLTLKIRIHSILYQTAKRHRVCQIDLLLKEIASTTPSKCQSTVPKTLLIPSMRQLIVYNLSEALAPH